jgi:hypothetical protein
LERKDDVFSRCDVTDFARRHSDFARPNDRKYRESRQALSGHCSALITAKFCAAHSRLLVPALTGSDKNICIQKYKAAFGGRDIKVVEYWNFTQIAVLRGLVHGPALDYFPKFP